MSKIYEVILHCPFESLSALIDVAVPQVKLISAKPVADEISVLPEKRAWAGGKRLKGISAKDYAIQLIKEGKTSLDQIQKAFVAHNPPFAIASAGSSVSLLIRDGVLIRASHGRYTMNPEHQEK